MFDMNRLRFQLLVLLKLSYLLSPVLSEFVCVLVFCDGIVKVHANLLMCYWM